MKKLFTLLALLTVVFSFSQVPQGISYQAIALNGSGNPIVSSPVGIKLSILDTSASGTVLYTETHTPTTNAQGLYNLIIGQGTATTGTFSTIKWETNSKFLKLEMDAVGGTNYVLVGSTQLLSVPYALYAGKVKSEDVVGGPDVSGSSFLSYSSSFMTSTHAYVYSEGTEMADQDTPPNPYSWFSTPISGTPVMKSINNFLTTTNAYIFGPSNDDPNSISSWHTYPISGAPYKIVNSTFITSTNAYAYYINGASVSWVPTPLSGTIVDVTYSAYSFGILTTTNAYTFNYQNGTWIQTPISGTPLKIKYTRSGLMVITSTNTYVYGPDMYSFSFSIPVNTYSWHPLPFSGTLLLD
jgi:hypothetical protein